MANKPTVKLEDVLEELDARISHIEDATLDNRDLLVKMVKQSNQIVKFLQSLEVEEISDMSERVYSTNEVDVEAVDRTEKLKALLDEFMDRHDELKEFEEELKKAKADIIPGQIAES
tara:strand:+ start:1189 stop:1539 length:351 start_codon:yes stop_codon:yes gene_type:complete